MEGAAPGGGSRGGAGGPETGRAQVGEGEERGGAAAPPLAPPLLRPPLPLLGILAHPAVGALLLPWVGPRTVVVVVVAAVPVVGGVSGDGGRSRARSPDCGRGVGGVFVAFEVRRLNLSRKRQKEEEEDEKKSSRISKTTCEGGELDQEGLKPRPPGGSGEVADPPSAGLLSWRSHQ